MKAVQRKIVFRPDMITTAVILAGGYGTRLSEETVIKPKPLVDIGGQPILWHLMKLLHTQGVKHFIICLGYKGYLIKEYFQNYLLHRSDVTMDFGAGTVRYHNRRTEDWTVSLIDTGKDTMTGGRLKRVSAYLDDAPFLMTYGDGLADINLAQLSAHHQTHACRATVTSVAPPGRFGALRMDGNARVTGFLEKPTGDGGRINGGFFILDKTVPDIIAGDDTIFEREPLETLARQGELSAYEHHGFWQPMDTLRDKTQLESLWQSGQAPWKLWQDDFA